MARKRSRSGANPAKRAQSERQRVIDWALCIFLFALVYVVFAPTTQHQFLNYDDDDYVYANPHVTRGLTAEGVRWAFTNVHAHNWHPLTTLSHMLDCQLFGLQPWGHHLTNVLLHAAAAVFLFLALRSLTARQWTSAFVAAVFAIHPLRAESVAWISERKDILSGIFFALTLWAYGRYARRSTRSLGSYFAALTFFVLGLMSKPTLVTLPFVLLLLDYWPLRRIPPARHDEDFATRWRGILFEKLPFFVLTAASCVVTFNVQDKAAAMGLKPDFAQRVGNALQSYVAYLGESVFPRNLAVFYPYHLDDLKLGGSLGAALLLLFVTAFFLVVRRSYPFLLVGWLWFLGMLVPMIGLVQVGLQSRADRYTYLPQIGLTIAATWIASELLGKLCPGRIWLAAAPLLVLFPLAARCLGEISFWRDSETLWNHAIENTSRNPVAQNSLGSALLDKGELARAAAHFEQALKFDPDSAVIHSNLGKTLERQGRIGEATVEFEKALQLQPEYADGFYDLGNVCMDKGQVEQAIAYYERALTLKPERAGVYNNLGNAFRRLGRFNEAVANYREAIRLRPDLSDPQFNLGNALFAQGNFADAIASYKTSLRLRPHSVAVLNSLGIAFAAAGETSEAVETLQSALRLDPNKPETYRNLAHVLTLLGRRDEVIIQLQEVLRLRPDDAETRQELERLGEEK